MSVLLAIFLCMVNGAKNADLRIRIFTFNNQNSQNLDKSQKIQLDRGAASAAVKFPAAVLNL
jgi:hypothetical protein